MSRYCLLFLCILCANTSFSQIPGYQGKRFFAEMGTSFWFNSFNPIASNKGPEPFSRNDFNDGTFTVQEHYFLSLSYVLSRKIVFSLEYEYSKTGLHIRENIPYLGPGTDYGAVTASRLVYGLVDYHNLFYNLYAHKTNFSFSHYFKPNANLAPLGWYFKWGFDLVLAKGVLLDQKVTYGHDPDFNDNKPSTEFTNPIGINADQIIPVFGAHLGLGHRAIIADRFIIHGAIQTTIFPFSSNEQAMNQAYRESRYEDRNNLNYRVRVRQRVQAHYYLNIVVGVGILIF